MLNTFENKKLYLYTINSYRICLWLYVLLLYVCIYAVSRWNLRQPWKKFNPLHPNIKKTIKNQSRIRIIKEKNIEKKSKYLKIPARLINVIFSGPVLTTSSISWHFLLIFKAKFYIFMIKNTRFVVIFKLTISTDRLGGAITFICYKIWTPSLVQTHLHLFFLSIYQLDLRFYSPFLLSTYTFLLYTVNCPWMKGRPWMIPKFLLETKNPVKF